MESQVRKQAWGRLHHSPPWLPGESWFLVFSTFSASEEPTVNERVNHNGLTLVTPPTAVINTHGKHSLAEAQVIQSKHSSKEVFLIIMTWCKYKKKKNVNYHSV